MAAAIYLARQKLKTAMLTGDFGGQAIWSSDVENYLGLHQLTGVQLVQRFVKHLEDYRKDIDLHENEHVTKLERIEGGFRATTEKGSYDAKTVLIASGSTHRALNIPGEKELSGKGISYCATCDAPLFKGKKVYVIGGGNSATDAALFVAKYAREVHIISINHELMGDSMLVKNCHANPLIKVHTDTKTIRFEGKNSIERIVLSDADGERVETAEGVFIEIGLMPNSGFVDFVGKDKSGQIIVDKFNATNVEGVYAAGDVTDITEKQIAIAVGEGSKAALSMIRYLQTTPRV